MMSSTVRLFDKMLPAPPPEPGWEALPENPWVHLKTIPACKHRTTRTLIRPSCKCKFEAMICGLLDDRITREVCSNCDKSEV